MLIVSSVDGGDWDSVPEPDFCPATAVSVRRRLAECVEALAERAAVDAELACEGVLDSDVVAALREEGVGWKVRPSQTVPWPGFGRRPGGSPRSRFFRCSRSGGDRR